MAACRAARTARAASKAGDSHRRSERATCGPIKCSLRPAPMRASRFRLAGDVVSQSAREKIAALDAGETNLVKKQFQLTRCIEVSYGVGEITNTLLALCRTAENHCREPYREAQVHQVWDFDDP